MNEQDYSKHYIRLDKNNNITDGFSDVHEHPKDGDICINEQGGYQFRLYPNGEERPPLSDDFNNPLYSYIDGEIVSNPAYVPDPADLLEHAKQSAISQTKSWVAAELNKPMQWTDGKMYTVTLDKQNLLSAQLGMYMMNKHAGTDFKLTWNASGEACAEWTFEDLLALSNAVAAHVSPVVSAQQYAEIRIREAVNHEQIQAVLQEIM